VSTATVDGSSAGELPNAVVEGLSVVLSGHFTVLVYSAVNRCFVSVADESSSVVYVCGLSVETVSCIGNCSNAVVRYDDDSVVVVGPTFSVVGQFAHEESSQT